MRRDFAAFRVFRGLLRTVGRRDVKALYSGLDAWKRVGYPVEGGVR